jgi:hypothetical protein
MSKGIISISEWDS